MTARLYTKSVEANTSKSLTLKTNAITRLTIDTSGNITTTGNTAIGTTLTASAYNGYTPLNRAGDTATGTINAANLTVQGNQVYFPLNSNRTIDRGNPGSGSPLLLDELDEAHLYSATGVSSIDISTTMVEDAVYELYYSCNTSGANIDITLQPNYTTYASQFQQYYWCTLGATSAIFLLDQVQSLIYFDHQNGSVGVNPCGRFVIHNSRLKKHVQYQGGDTLSIATGTGRWNNTDTQWVNVGTLGGLQSATDVRVIVRRIG